jgi:hypothetical protein
MKAGDNERFALVTSRIQQYTPPTAQTSSFPSMLLFLLPFFRPAGSIAAENL